MITKNWVIENGIGHWEVTVDDRFASCDEGELSETIKELKDEANM